MSTEYQYYHKVPECKGRFEGYVDDESSAYHCVCWHDEGDGPLGLKLSSGTVGIKWRIKPPRKCWVSVRGLG